MKYFSNCSDCGKKLDDMTTSLFQEMQGDRKLGKWWRANKCVMCNIKSATEMIKLEQQLNQVLGWHCLNWQKFPADLL